MIESLLSYIPAVFIQAIGKCPYPVSVDILLRVCKYHEIDGGRK